MWFRRLHLFLVGLSLWAWSSTAQAWVETSIRSHSATVDLTRGGQATVTHQVVLKVRGGPFKSMQIEGVDEDAQLNPDATVVQAQAGSQQAWPLLLHKSDDGSLTVEVDDKKGLRGGVYQFTFSYQSDFVGRDLLQQRGGSVHLSWVGPRFADGIDTPRAIFRIPKGDTPPRLPEPQPQGDYEPDRDLAGLLVSQVRRGPDKDEIELVRTHVAKGEPALWRLQASARSFDAFTPPEATASPNRDDPPGELHSLRASWLFVSVAIALLYAALVALKWSLSRKQAAGRRIQVRALVPLPWALRAALAGASLAGAFLAAVASDYPTLMGVLLVASMAFAAQLPPLTHAPLRGPGRWLRLTEAQAFQVKPVASPGRLLDSGSLPGFALFCVCLVAFGGAAALLFPSQPYHASVVALGASCLLPIFCTGRMSELPPDPVARPRKLFAALARKLGAEPGWKITPYARVPEQREQPDELRLLIEPEGMPAGFVALELGLEYQVASGAVVDLPCLVVRVRDDSPAYYALPRSVVWSRGRDSSERVALLRPKLPTRALCAQLVKEVVATLRAAREPGRFQVGRSNASRMSGGKGLDTSKRSMALASQRM